MTMFRVRDDGRVLVPIDPVDLRPGQEVDLHIATGPDAPRVGSPAAVLAAIRAMPHLSADDIDEFERLINEGKTPAKMAGCFDSLEEAHRCPA